MTSNNIQLPFTAHADRLNDVKSSPLVIDMTGLNQRALAKCGDVMKWLGISGKNDGTYFEGHLTVNGSGISEPFLLARIDGRWECVNDDQPFGKDFISFAALALGVAETEAAIRLEQFINVLDAGTDFESVSDVGLPADPVSAPIIPVPTNVVMPESFGWLGEPAAEYAVRSMSGDLFGYALRFDDFSLGSGPCGLGRPLFVPLTYWQAVDGSKSWRTKHLQGSIPLFGANNLVVNSKASVVLTQDERSAEYADAIC